MSETEMAQRAQAFTSRDETFMRRAFALARRGEGYVEPNPMVACVIVKSGRIVGEGYHRRFGGPHAEVHALRAAGAKASGATAYVTLEPCCHQGKTPPCTEALISAKVQRVVFAHGDPFEKVAGKGMRRLRRAGIAVERGLLEADAARMMAPYLKLMREGRPWVILKWAQSIDGKIATRGGDSKWISSPASLKRVHRLRGRVDAVVVGVETARVDDPELTCREGRARRVATRVVIDPQLRLSTKAKLIKSAEETPTLVFTSNAMSNSSKVKAFRERGVEVAGLRRRGRDLDLGQMLELMGARGMANIMVEGGGRTLGRFVDAKLADEAWVFVSPRLIGGKEAPGALGGLGAKQMSEVYAPKKVERTRSGDDLFYRLMF